MINLLINYGEVVKRNRLRKTMQELDEIMKVVRKYFRYFPTTSFLIFLLLTGTWHWYACANAVAHFRLFAEEPNIVNSFIAFYHSFLRSWCLHGTKLCRVIFRRISTTMWALLELLGACYQDSWFSFARSQNKMAGSILIDT